MGPGPAVAGIRNAVRDCLADLTSASSEPGCLVLAACSGGADSLALAAALAFVGPRLGLCCGGVTVDHGLQDGSAERAAAVVTTLTGLGLEPVYNIAVQVPATGGPEAAARVARYQALDQLARPAPASPAPASPAPTLPAVAILLGHTLDDQAETVLLGLARGAGGRSLAGMPARRGPYRRPLLGIRRAATMAACAELGLEPWHDPHNADDRYARARVRHQALPALEEALGPGVAQALARTAAQLRQDADCLDDLAFAESEHIRGAASDPPGLDVRWLAALPAAIRTRVLRQAAISAGCPAGALTAGHVQQADELVTCWHGQRWADLPGGVRVRRRDGKLWFAG
ncbi:MAG TPA: tRNA lysidine(34) synthetase TilS [Streptosporangiaceae bacterium]|nr:tRNA lysidine(34) synthetase TilS [Streptosporangiaceae bacterium]